jgi:glycosyltransferase involved in cell wall biosynthesis
VDPYRRAKRKLTIIALSISVVIPVKDDAEHLRRCLAQLALQTRLPNEIVIVDNGSVDDSAAVAIGWGARVVDRPGGGIPAASAAGYDAARGDVIARLDADCLPAVDWLDRIERAFTADSGLTAVTGGAYFIDGPRPIRAALIVLYLGSYFVSVGSALGHVPLFGSNFAMRRSAWLEARDSMHSNDPVVHDDMDLSMHLGPTRRIRFDRNLSMGISIRPFFSARGFLYRFKRGFHSILIHWPEEFPWLRWYRRFTAPRR